MNISIIKENIALAQAIAKECTGENPSHEIVAALLNAITAQSIN